MIGCAQRAYGAATGSVTAEAVSYGSCQKLLPLQRCCLNCSSVCVHYVRPVTIIVSDMDGPAVSMVQRSAGSQSDVCSVVCAL